MKIIKNNWWNRIFKKDSIIRQSEEYKDNKRIIRLYSEIMFDINDSKSLEKLIEIHKIMWKYGFRNENLGPNAYGMFRTKDIENMTPNEVYLGDIWGIRTNNIPFWENHKEEDMSENGFGIDPSIKIYDLIMTQYRTLLRRNAEIIKEEAKKYVEDYDKINNPKNPYKLW